MTYQAEEIPSSLHFVGTGGIGMSALAQMAASLGIETSGSDRAIDRPENAAIFNALRERGVKLYAQDGSRFTNGKSMPGALVYSTAIEKDNPDFLAAGDGLRKLHRSDALRMLVSKLSGSVAAVTGSCGKTSVSAWLAECLDRLGEAPELLCGGLARHFIRPGFAGNYARGAGKFCVLEADESDKSLLRYSADRAVILNIGTDHYSKEELARVFSEFLKKTRVSAVIGKDVLEAVPESSLAHLDVTVFTDAADSPDEIRGHRVVRTTDYSASPNGVFARIDGGKIRLPAPGRHNALNAAAVYALLRQAGFEKEKILSVLGAFSGVWRRFDFAGKTANGTRIYDDYAHNVEKLASCISGAREICRGRLAILFQPHGFKPLEFMREELHVMLKKELRPGDVFAFLPVYYAGGTASFKPTSREVAEEYANDHLPPGFRQYFNDRNEAEVFLNTLGPDDLAVVAGARDNSLSVWAAELGKFK